MAHWAELDENNIVLRVVVGNNNHSNEGYDWLIENLGGRWIKTSYNHNIRARFAGIGYYYDEERDIFIAPQPYPSWILNNITTEWESPIPYPKDNEKYVWDEENLSWIKINE